MTTGDARTCLVPDLDDELTGALSAAEELFISLDAVDEDGAELPQPAVLVALVGQQGRPWDAARHAAGSLWEAVAPTQGERAAGLPRLYGPDGRYEHMPLRFVEVDPDDLAAIAAAAGALGQDLAAHPYGDAADVLGDYVGSRDAHARTSPAELVERLARVHGLLDLAWTDDVELLRARIVDAGGDVVLDEDGEAAYQRTATRLNGMWTSGSGLDRYLY